MTTMVMIVVPEGARYEAEVTVGTPTVNHTYKVQPGHSLTTYAYGEQTVTVKEVPL